jgi:hypothetical protein
MKRRHGLSALLIGAAITGATAFGLLSPTLHQPTAQAAQTGNPASADDDRTARVLDAFGTVERQPLGTSKWNAINVGDLLPEQTTLRTGANGATLLQLPKSHLLRVGAGTTVLLRQLNDANQFSFKVLSGQVWSMVRKANHPAKFEVETPSAVAGVTGTIFSVSADAQTGETLVTTDEGSVVVRQDGQQAPVVGGRFLRLGRHYPGGSFLAQPQTPPMRTMWGMLRKEGILVRRHDMPAPPGGFRGLHMQRDLDSRFYRSWFGDRAHPPVSPYGLAPLRDGKPPRQRLMNRRPMRDARQLPPQADGATLPPPPIPTNQ